MTQLQDHFNNLCFLMYNYVGALQVRICLQSSAHHSLLQCSSATTETVC